MGSLRKRVEAKRIAVAVRPKSSARKSRSAVADHTARKPLQDRSMARFERILTATQELLEKANLEDISFYDVAAQAQISPASVNYLFPTMAALRTELMRRYAHEHAEAMLEAPRAMARMRNPSWQEWVRFTSKEAQKAYNANRAMSEVVLGPVLNRESRRAQLEENVRAAHEMIQTFAQFFVMPSIPGLEEQFVMSFDMFDGLWSSAYIKHGYVDDYTVEETIKMRIAYMRTVLPETLPIASRMK